LKTNYKTIQSNAIKSSSLSISKTRVSISVPLKTDYNTIQSTQFEISQNYPKHQNDFLQSTPFDISQNSPLNQNSQETINQTKKKQKTNSENTFISTPFSITQNQSILQETQFVMEIPPSVFKEKKQIIQKVTVKKNTEKNSQTLKSIMRKNSLSSVSSSTDLQSTPFSLEVLPKKTVKIGKTPTIITNSLPRNKG